MKNNQGYTLIEVLVVTSIMALFSLTLIAVFLATVRGGVKSQKLQMVHQDGDFALETMARTIRQSKEVDCGVDFTTTAEDGTATIFSLVDDGGVMKVASNLTEFLTGDVAQASGLSFTCYEGDTGNQVVTISFTLTGGDEVGAQVQEKITQGFATSVSTRTY
ncbi:PilW family protein [Patescibacteria group bacterium]